MRTFTIDKCKEFDDLVVIDWKDEEGYHGTWIIDTNDLDRLRTAIHEFLGEEPKKLAPLHPGEVLYDEFIKPKYGTIDEFLAAFDIGVMGTRIYIHDLCEIKDAISQKSAEYLSKILGTTPEFWLDLQADYDREMAEDKND